MEKNEEMTLSPIEQLLDHPAVVWATVHAKELFFGLIGFFVLLALLSQSLLGHSTNSVTQRKQIETELKKLQDQLSVSLSSKKAQRDLSKSADTLNGFLKSAPQFQPTYDGLIAQQLLAAKMPKQAKPFVKRARARSKSAPQFSLFSDIALALAKGKSAKALESIPILEEKTAQYDLLTAYSLVQRAAMSRHLESAEEERVSWEKWREYRIKQPEVAARLERAFILGNLSIEDYIQARERLLNR